MEYVLGVYIYACAYLGVAIFNYISRRKDFDSFWPALGAILLCLIIGELLVVWVALGLIVVVGLLVYLKARVMIDDWQRSRRRSNA